MSIRFLRHVIGAGAMILLGACGLVKKDEPAADATPPQATAAPTVTASPAATTAADTATPLTATEPAPHVHHVHPDASVDAGAAAGHTAHGHAAHDGGR